MILLSIQKLENVPASQLNYNSAADRFELPMAKADVVALAEGERRAGYAADSTTPAATRAGKQSFADEATRVQNALASDPQTSAFAQKVTVTTAGDSCGAWACPCVFPWPPRYSP